MFQVQPATHTDIARIIYGNSTPNSPDTIFPYNWVTREIDLIVRYIRIQPRFWKADQLERLVCVDDCQLSLEDF